MKFLSLLLFMLSFDLMAQIDSKDFIYLKNKTVIEGEILDISEKEITYLKQKKVLKIAIKDILKVRSASGDVRSFDTNTISKSTQNNNNVKVEENPIPQDYRESKVFNIPSAFIKNKNEIGIDYALFKFTNDCPIKHKSVGDRIVAQTKSALELSTRFKPYQRNPNDGKPLLIEFKLKGIEYHFPDYVSLITPITMTFKYEVFINENGVITNGNSKTVNLIFNSYVNILTDNFLSEVLNTNSIAPILERQLYFLFPKMTSQKITFDTKKKFVFVYADLAISDKFFKKIYVFKKGMLSMNFGRANYETSGYELIIKDYENGHFICRIDGGKEKINEIIENDEMVDIIILPK